MRPPPLAVRLGRHHHQVIITTSGNLLSLEPLLSSLLPILYATEWLLRLSHSSHLFAATPVTSKAYLALLSPSDQHSKFQCGGLVVQSSISPPDYGGLKAVPTVPTTISTVPHPYSDAKVRGFSQPTASQQLPTAKRHSTKQPQPLIASGHTHLLDTASPTASLKGNRGLTDPAVFCSSYQWTWSFLLARQVDRLATFGVFVLLSIDSHDDGRASDVFDPRLATSAFLISRVYRNTRIMIVAKVSVMPGIFSLPGESVGR